MMSAGQAATDSVKLGDGKMDGGSMIKVYIYGDDSAASDAEHDEYRDWEVEQKGGVDKIKYMTREQAKAIDVDLSHLQED
jgi:hypothetical protein